MWLDGVYYEKIRCSLLGNEIKIPILFSIKVSKREENRFLVRSFLPMEVQALLRDKEFYIEADWQRTKHKKLKRARIERNSENEAWILILDDEMFEDRRLFERIPLCKNLEMNVLELNMNATVLDISLTGIKLFFKGFDVDKKVKIEQTLTLQQDSKILTVKVVRVEKKKEGLLAGCKIERANFNLMKFIMNSYVSLIKSLLSPRMS